MDSDTESTGQMLPSNALTQSVVPNVDDVLGLNMNPEVPVELNPVRQRRPRFLQEEHLLSARGVSYIRKHASKRLKKSMSHKDHYKNLTNMLTFYQIWGHNLFPKAKFGDFLEMCATAGKGSRIRALRRSYMGEDQGTSREKEMMENFLPTTTITDATQTSTAQDDEDDEFERAFLSRANGIYRAAGATTSSEQAPTSQPSTSTTTTTTTTTADPLPSTLFVQDNEDSDDGFDDDDDDDLFANIDSKQRIAQPPVIAEDDPSLEDFNEADAYEAEMDAMREYGM